MVPTGVTQMNHGGIGAVINGPQGAASSSLVAKLLSQELVYKFNTPDAANMSLLKTEALALYVAEAYGVAMMNLVKYGREKTFTKPTATAPATRSKDTGVDSDSYKVELGFYYKQKEAYDENKGKVFGLILKSCHVVTKTKLESDVTFADLEQRSDVVGLLSTLKTLAFSTGEAAEPFAALLNVLKRMVGMNQGPSESVANYYRRFMAQISVMESQWGAFFPPLVVTNAGGTSSPITEKAARDQLLGMMFLHGADKKRFENLRMDLHNSFIGKVDKYPRTVEDMYTLLMNYQDHSIDGKHSSNNGMTTEKSFIARQTSVRCFSCGELGHVKKNCPRSANNTKKKTEETDGNSVRGNFQADQIVTPWST